jgi:hypothetical protein
VEVLLDMPHQTTLVASADTDLYWISKADLLAVLNLAQDARDELYAIANNNLRRINAFRCVRPGAVVMGA